jgi:hypothetical protein
MEEVFGTEGRGGLRDERVRVIDRENPATNDLLLADDGYRRRPEADQIPW